MQQCSIRGLVDTDGSVFPKSRNKNMPQIEICCKIPHLQNSISRAFSIIDIKASKWSRSNTPNSGIYSQKEIFKYWNLVGFNNPKHSRKFREIYHALVV